MQIVHRRFRALAVLAAFLVAGCAAPVQRGAENPVAANRHVVAAETALAAGDYIETARQYRLAAENADGARTLQAAAEIALDFGVDADAAYAVERWAELEPDAPEPVFHQGRLALRGGAVERAVEQFSRYIERAESRDEAFEQVTRALLVEGSGREALKIGQGLTRVYPEDWQAQRIVSRVAMRIDEKNLAFEAAEFAYNLAPDVFGAALLQAQAIVLGGDTPAGLEFAAEAAELAETSGDMLDYAGLLAAANAFDEARKVIDGVRDSEPDNLEALQASALLRLRTGELEPAWEELSQLAQSGDYQHEALFYLGTIAERQQRYDQAIRIYTQVGDGENTALAQQRVSRILLQTGRSEAAVGHLEDFALQQPEYGFQLLLPRAGLLREVSRYEEALEIYDLLLALDPDSEPLLLTRAETFLENDLIDDAVAGYRRALELHPDSAVSLNALGYTLADKTTEYDEARRLIERALELDPDNPAIIDSMGWVLFRLGDLTGAREYLELAWSLIKDPEVAAHLGETLWMLGEIDEAKAILREAYERSPDSKPLRETLKRLLELESGITS